MRLTQSPLQLLVFGQFNSQIAQLSWIDFRRRLRHEVHGAVVLRESHHVANTLFAADQHNQTIETERDSAMWRRAEPKRTQQMAELQFSSFRIDPERLEHFFLQLRFVNSHAAAANLNAVQND